MDPFQCPTQLILVPSDRLWLTGGGGAPGAGGAGGAPDVAEDMASEVAAGAAVVLLAGAVTLSKPGMEDNFNIKIIQFNTLKSNKMMGKKIFTEHSVIFASCNFCLNTLANSFTLSWIPPDPVVLKEW